MTAFKQAKQSRNFDNKAGLPRQSDDLLAMTNSNRNDRPNDRLAPLLFHAKELSKTRLREINARQAHYWTVEKRAQKAKIINDNKPWLKSTGPKTDAGKARARKNSLKHGFYSEDYRELCRLLRLQKTYVREEKARTWENIRELQALYAKQKRMSTLDQKAKQIHQFLAEAGVKASAHEVKRLMKEVTGFGEDVFITQPDKTLTPAQDKALDDVVARRAKGEPLYRIFGSREFWGLEFNVTPETLDPRPDTETLVESALKWVRQHPKNQPNSVIARRLAKDTMRVNARAEADEAIQCNNNHSGLPRSVPSLAMTPDDEFKILDLGTGTGCILIALLSELPNATGVAVDFSLQAALVAQENARKNGVADRFSIIQGDWMEALKADSFDLIVSNPPYIPTPDIENLAKEVKNHDPFMSLSGGKDGLDCYKKIIFGLKNHLNHNNRAFLEIGFGQLESLTGLVEESNLRLCDSHLDIAGIPRVVEISSGDK